MKNHYKPLAFMFIFLGSLCSALGQTCLPGGITFGSQADVDNFAINHPNCSEIQGNVTINSSTITNLNGLSQINSIGGDLRITTTNLTNLNGLNNLTDIGLQLLIGPTSDLTSLSGLNSLTNVSVQVALDRNFDLTSLDGLNNLNTIGGAGLDIDFCPKLSDLNALSNLTNITRIELIGNPQITSLSAFSNITSLDLGLQIAVMDGLTNLNGLDNLNSVGFLNINTNPNLTSLIALSNLRTVINSFLFIDNDNLISLTGLENVNILNQRKANGDIQISGNQMLSDCAIQSVCNFLADPALDLTNGNIVISNNAAGSNCNSPTEVITACPSLINLNVDCLNDYPIPNTTYTGDVDVSVVETITSMGRHTNQTTTIYTAGSLITLNSGFRVDADCDFNAKIQSCTPQ